MTKRTRDRNRCSATIEPKKPARRIDCFEPFDEAELEGHACFGGLDLALVHDCSGLELAFPWGTVESTVPSIKGEPPRKQVDELYRIVTRFWLPEETARRLRDQVPYEHWASQGWIKLTDGNEVDFPQIVEDIGELSKRFGIREIRYDRAYATQVMQEVEARYGVPRIEFPQTTMHYTLPSGMLERLISKKLIRHNGNPVLTWQLGHVKVKSDSSGNIKPVRPQKGDFRTVDGVQALIMALSGALDRPRDSESEWDGTVDYI